MTGVTEEMAIAAAKAELEFDGRSWMGVSRSDRERYVARARAALSSVIGEGDVVVPVEGPWEALLLLNMSPAGGDDAAQARYGAIVRIASGLRALSQTGGER